MTAATTDEPEASVARDIAAIIARALALWPGLDRRALIRTRGEPGRITRLVKRRTSLPEESIEAMLRTER
jgi:hypothetical protein